MESNELRAGDLSTGTPPASTHPASTLTASALSTDAFPGNPLAADPARSDLLVLVDGLDRPIGTATKAKAHAEGLLHRAFSVVLVRGSQAGEATGVSETPNMELLLAQRAAGKYHSAGLWANSCCSHPRAGEELLAAAYRRVHEELGCTAMDLHEIGAFAYRAEFANGLAEYEYDHVLLGRCADEAELSPDPSEVAAVRWMGPDALAAELAAEPHAFAAWAPMVLSMALAALR